MGGNEFFQRLLALFAQRPDFIERFAGLLRNVVNVRGKKRCGFCKRREITASCGDCALSGHEFSPPRLPNLFSFAQKDASNLAGLADVSSPARSQVEFPDINEAQFITLGRRELAQS